MSQEKFNKQEFIDFINQGKKCNEKCMCHHFYTHNTCLTCSALKDSPYHKDYLQDKTDKQIADEIQEIFEYFEG